MNINAVKLVYFSPTQTTKRVVEGIAQGIRVDTVEQIDLTPSEARTREFEEMGDQLAIIGAPVYDGRIPIDAVHRGCGDSRRITRRRLSLWCMEIENTKMPS